MRYAAARQTLVAGRAAFFPQRADQPDRAGLSALEADDLIPQFGFTGSRYADTGVLILSINPGNGGRAARNEIDRYMLSALARFRDQPSEANYAAATRAYHQEWPFPNIKDDIRKILRETQLTGDDIAYFNVLPWHTLSQSGFGRAVEKRTARLFLAPLLDELRPREIVAHGKAASRVLNRCGNGYCAAVNWDRSHVQRQKDAWNESELPKLRALGQRVRGRRA